MSEGRVVVLGSEDVAMLIAQLGEQWVEEFTQPGSCSKATARLCAAIEELGGLEYGQCRHQRRADGRGCTCGWNGADMLGHLVECRRRREVTDLAVTEYLADDAVRYLQTLMRDPDWAAAYWAARSRANDDVALIFEALHRLGAEITLVNREYRVRFPGAGDVERHSFAGAGFPLAIDSQAWDRPPGRYLQIWADASGLREEEAAGACGIALDVYRGLLSGSICITTGIAQQLEHGTNTYPANVWLMLERAYRAALVERANRPHH